MPLLDVQPKLLLDADQAPAYVPRTLASVTIHLGCHS